MKLEDQHNAASPQPNRPVHGADAAPTLNPECWIQEYGDVLFGFAVMRVRDRAIAQDLVQETFLAGIKAKDGFRGRSTERAWLFGILRNKLVDHYRLQAREMPLVDSDSFLPEEKGLFAETGLGKDGWKTGLGPEHWDTPEELLISKEFHEALNSCLRGLPDKVAQVFILREIDDVSSEEICKDLGVSPNNVWVMLHRARMGLRRCLEVHWFGKKRNDK